ncbi:glycosyltransferase involved in cell wall biosynthesis [Streptomyces zagrosensis]|uniref:Glycosyltransferase involved in cell wall biosynthesis n=1 Tax=Streptomyces zagrosensis TaxID=1042984 RepID=A0A7W9Q9Z0_9ACTN|nr:glycosyltransferase involved in cell wall biosynthesis [Streptomyces zagrosensis]
MPQDNCSPQDDRAPRDTRTPQNHRSPQDGATPERGGRGPVLRRCGAPRGEHLPGACTGSPLTVLHVSQPVSGGVARVVTDLVRGQLADGLRPVVACPPGGTLGAAATEAGAEVLCWSARRAPGPGLPAETARLARIIRALGPDLVHTHSAKAGLAGRLAVRGRVPTLHQPHAWSFDASDGALHELAVRWERYAARWAARLVCVSEDERRRGVEAGIAAGWEVVRNGVDTHRFAPADAAARRAARTRLPALRGVPDTAPLLVCVGRLCRQKGQDVLLDAWPRIAAGVPGARLVLVGEGPAQHALRAAAPSDVIFAGATCDPARWYAAADLVVLPSRWEGMALAPLEAMACGRPVVLTEVSGARESLPPGHAPRCLVPPAAPGALAHAVTALLANPRLCALLGAEASCHARERHDVRRVVAALTRLYGEVIGPSPAAAPQQCGRCAATGLSDAGDAGDAGEPSRVGEVSNADPLGAGGAETVARHLLRPLLWLRSAQLAARAALARIVRTRMPGLLAWRSWLRGRLPGLAAGDRRRGRGRGGRGGRGRNRGGCRSRSGRGTGVTPGAGAEGGRLGGRGVGGHAGRRRRCAVRRGRTVTRLPWSPRQDR